MANTAHAHLAVQPDRNDRLDRQHVPGFGAPVATMASFVSWPDLILSTGPGCPEDFLEGEKLARQRKVEIIGFYHSHPNAEAKPSPYDLEHGWPWYSYVIVAIRNKKAKEVTSWVMEDQRKKFHEETIIII